jgi:hypothetical protein
VQDALGRLVKRQLVVARASMTAIPVYTVLRPWRQRRRRPSGARVPALH